MVSERSCSKDKKMDEAKVECPKCEGAGCDHCDDKGYHEKEVAEKKLDPVSDKENDKKFKDRKDKDIDNDGDVDSSDEFLHKRRKAIDNEKDGGEKPAKEGDGEQEAPAAKDDDGEQEAPAAKDDDKKKKKPVVGNSGGKTAEISKIESVVTREEFNALWTALEEAIGQKKGATAPEGMDDKESPKGKEFKAKHKVDALSHDDLEKVEEPKERKVKKEMTEFEVIRALLSGKPTGE